METNLHKLRTKIPQLYKMLKYLPGFTGIGIGLNNTDVQSHQLCWRMYVNTSHVNLLSQHLSWLGIPIIVISRSTTITCSYGGSKVDLVRPGVQIAGDAGGEGTLGCFAVRKGDPSKIVILSNSHAIYKDAGSYLSMNSGSYDIGQHDISCSWCCKCRVIATAQLVEAKKAFNHVRVKPDSSSDIEEGSEIDCAIADYNKKRDYTNEIEKVGMISGTPSPGTFGLVAGSNVKKMGTTTGLTSGKVVAFKTNAHYEDGTPLSNLLFPFRMGNEQDNIESGAQYSINQFFFVPDPDPDDPQKLVYFAEPGDSGSVVVNDSLQVVAMISRAVNITDQFRIDFNNVVDPAFKIGNNIGSIGTGMPIGLVLTALDIEILPNLKGTATSAGEQIFIKEGGTTKHVHHDDWLSKKSDDIQALICSTPDSAHFFKKIRNYRAEVLYLINKKRQVTLCWHRMRGPAFIAACLRKLRDPGYTIPHEINGIKRTKLIREMANILSIYGSDNLKNDIALALPVCLEHIDDLSDVDSLVLFFQCFTKINMTENIPVNE